MKRKLNFLLQSGLGRFFLFFLVFIIADIILESINHRFSVYDFKVYWGASKALWNNRPVYGVAFDLPTGFYKYSPFVLLPFAVYNHLPAETAGLFHDLLEGCCFIGICLQLQQLLEQQFSNELNKGKLPFGSIFFAAFWVVVIALVREFHLGNVNLIVLFLLVGALCRTLREKASNDQFWGGVMLGLAALIKPFLVVLILAFVFNQKRRAIWGLLGILFFAPIAVAAFMGFNPTWHLFGQWFIAMSQHSQYLQSNHTLSSILSNYLSVKLPFSSYVFFVGVVLFYAVFNLLISREKSTSNLLRDYLALLAILPNVLITDTEHFLWSFPIIVFIISELYVGKTPIFHNQYRHFVLFVLIVVFFLFGGNSSDLLTNKGSEWFENHSLLGIANLALIVVFLRINPRRIFKMGISS